VRMQYSIEGLGSELLVQFKLCDGGCAMMWYARYKREVLDAQCSVSRPTSKSVPYSMPSAITIGLWTAFVRQRKWVARIWGHCVKELLGRMIRGDPRRSRCASRSTLRVT